MRHQKVKILAFFLAVFIAVASFPALKSNAAGGEIPNSNLTWTLDGNGKLTIDGTGAMPYWSAAANVPWNSSKSNIKTVEIKSGVTTIGPYAFRSHSNLTSISIPSTVTSIGSYSFQNCNKLTAIIIPNSVTSIGSYAFTSCTTLSSLSLSSNLTEIGNDAFKSCKALTSVSIPNGVTTISANAFNGCESMTTLSIPNSVTTIDEYAFYKCSKLNSVILPSSLITIGKAAFGYCSTITSITVPNGVNTIGVDAFACCTSLTAVTLPDSLLHIYNGAFRNCSNLSSINIPNELMFIGTNAFGYCSALTTFSIPASITTFGFDALGNTGVSKVTYKGTRSQWLNIDTLYDPELNWDMDKEMAKYNIEVIFSNGSNELTITSNPSNVTGRVGNTATFSVRATGDGLTYQWNEFVDGEWVACTYTGSTTANLKVPITCNKDGRRYDCTVTDKYGHSAASNSATLTIDRTTLKINNAPVNYTGLVGETAIFNVVAQGDEMTYQWQVNKTGTWEDSIIPEANTSKITISITNARSGYKFRCIVTDGYGKSVTSSAATLTALPPISITSQPKDYSGIVGDKATFTVVATGTNLTYQWQTNKNGTWADSSLTGAKTSSLSIDLTAARNGYKFRCIIKDSKGNTLTSNVATLTVTQGVAITKDPENASGPVNGKATFKVVTSGEGLKYQWQVNKGNGWADSSMTGSKTDTLSVDITAARNGYKFRCIVKSSNGAVTLTSKEATLTVVQSLSITKDPANFSGPAGSRALFTVAADGNGLKYQWQVNKGNGWSNSSMTGSKTDTLTVDITAARNGYKFRCIVTDSTGNTVTSKDATLTVSASLAITQDPENFTGTVGSVAKYTVVASGDGLKYQWQVNKGNGWTDSSMTGSKTATLSVDITAARNGYSFRCVVKDSLGNTATSREAYLKVVEAPRSSDFKNEIDLGEVVHPSNAAATEDDVEYEPSEANDVVVSDVVYISESVVTDIDTAVSESDIASEVS